MRPMELKSVLANSGRVCLDTESNSVLSASGPSWLTDDVFMVSIGWGAEPSFEQSACFDAKEPGLKELLQWVYDGYTGRVVAHNAKFDRHMIRKTFGLETERLIDDTMIMAQLIDETKPKGLKLRSEIECGNPDLGDYERMVKHYISKYSLRSYAEVPREIMGPYARQDVVLTGMLDDVFYRDIQKDFASLYETEIKLTRLLVRMEKAGVRVDRELLFRLQEQFTKKLAEAQDALTKEVGRPVDLPKGAEDYNFSSNDHIAHILYNHYGFPVLERTDDGKPSTDIKTLSLIRGQVGKHPVLDLLLEYRQVGKQLGTYIEPFIQFSATDGRIHADFNQCGTRTGRFSCVPLSAEILTKSGWRTHNELVIGEQVAGYDLNTRKLIWTDLKDIVHTTNKLGELIWTDETNKQFSIPCTDNHRWVVQDNEVLTLVPAHDLDKNKYRLLLNVVYGISSFEFIHPACDTEEVEVWCPTTGTGTWVMRCDDQIAITGNCTKPNLQNVTHPDEEDDESLMNLARTVFIVDDVEDAHMDLADYDQIEMRGYAHYTGDPALIQAFHENLDPYAEVASWVYGGTREDYPKKSPLRKKGKTVGLAVIYGAGGKTIGRYLDVSETEGRRIIQRFFQGSPKSKWLRDEVRKRLESRGFVFNSFGRRFRLTSEESFKGINSIIQGWAADLVKSVMVKIDETLPTNDVKGLRSTIHDELRMDGYDFSEVSEVIDIMQDHNYRVPIKVTHGRSYSSWAETQ